ncbi:MAG: AAA family ATPase [Opitutaceae bacterium]
MKLTHVGISNFRSIGAEFVTIDLTKKINVLVGANNCGKSNVLRAVDWLGSPRTREKFSPVDLHQRSDGVSPAFQFTLQAEEDDHQTLQRLNHFHIKWSGGSAGADPIPLWISLENLSFEEFSPLFSHYTRERFVRRLTSEETAQHHLRIASTLLPRVLKNFPAVCLIPQFREIRPDDNYSIGGHGIVKLLAAWHHPEIGKDADHHRFLQVQDLLRRFLENPNVSLEVSHRHDQILVSHKSLRLPLDSYGTGIHELIILAIAVLSHDNALVCIEEPEIHLHPLLQRRFLEFLRAETTNRYVLTTHSPALIAPNADTAVTHLWLEAGVTKSRLVETTSHSLEALRDLGAKASDLLQANSVIWVEGPSDRIYLNRWLELLCPNEFREGIDYAIMFYGGRLLAHVSLEREVPPDSEEVDELIHLLRINQHSAILIDSDRRKAADSLNGTKLRVKEECMAAKIPCWVTDGREIENYLSYSAIAAAYAELTSAPATFKFAKFDALEDALKKTFRKSWPRSSYYNEAKPKLARRIATKITADQLTPELNEWIRQLARVIRHEPN